MHALGHFTGTAFSLGQPFAKRFHIVPAYAHDRIRWALFKPRLLPGCTAPLPSVLTNRVHAFRRVVAGALDECMKVLQARIPNVEQHLCPGDRHEFHP